MERKTVAEHPSQKRKLNRIFDLNIKQSMGVMSSTEYKRRIILNELYHLSYVSGLTSFPRIPADRNPPRVNSIDYQSFLSSIHDDILGIEIDPRESRCLLAISRYNNVAIYDVSRNVQTFKQMKRMTIPHNPIDSNRTPNSAHWLWDGTVFSVCTMDSVYFWDSYSCEIIETVRMRTKVLNHVMAAKKYSANKYVAVTGIEGHVFMIDMLHGIVVMTMNNVENRPIRAIHWHPSNELQYAVGNDNGNIFLWDVRFQKKFVVKFNNGDSFSKTTSHSNPVIGLRFYNNGNSIISVDNKGVIKTWEVGTGYMRPNHYESVSLSDLNEDNVFKDYQFAVTENLKDDIVFLPSTRGLRMFDIESGEHLPHTSDVFLPMNCATYDAKRICVYASHHSLLSFWSTELNRSDDHFQ